MPLWTAPCGTPETVFQGYPKAPCSLTSSELSRQVTVLCSVLLPPVSLHMWWLIIITEYPRSLSGTGTPSELTSRRQRGHATTHSDSSHQGCEDDCVRTAPSRTSTNKQEPLYHGHSPTSFLGKNAKEDRLPGSGQGGAEVGRGCGCGTKGRRVPPGHVAFKEG